MLYKGIAGSDEGKAPETVSPGDLVKVVSMNQIGEVLKTPDNDCNVYVQLGIMKVYIPLSDLRMAETKEQQETKANRNKMSAIKSSAIKTEVDIRGCNVDEAIVILDKYLDDAMIAHLKTFSVIHGKGTGALRAGIHNYLRSVKYIKNFRLGAYGEGDAGVTIVTLK